MAHLQSMKEKLARFQKDARRELFRKQGSYMYFQGQQKTEPPNFGATNIQLVQSTLFVQTFAITINSLTFCVHQLFCHFAGTDE